MAITISRALRIACAFALVLCFASMSFAQGTAGKVSGTVIDKSTRESLPAASIRVEGTSMGAMADEKGQYFILNLPPGSYNLIVNVIGYAPIRVEGVRVMQDFTSYQDFELESTVLEVTEAVTVIAERPLVEKSLTSSRTLMAPDEIKALPIVNISQLILTTAGSIAGNLRGGRSVDQQVTLDGAVVTGMKANTGQAFTVNPYMIQELEVKTGTFNAEYTNALSGITSVVTKDGGAKFSGNMEYRTLGQAGFNWMAPPDIDLVDRLRTGESDVDDLKGLIRSAINATSTFNDDPARLDDALELKFPFDVAFDTSAADPLNWKAVFSRSNYYWDYDRVHTEPDGKLFSYLTNGLPIARSQSFTVDRAYHPDKYNKFQRNNRTEKRPVQLDWGMGGPVGGKMNWFFSGRFSENWGRNPNQYNRLMNFFGKITLRPTASTKLSMSGMIEDAGFFSGKGNHTAAVGTKYLAEAISNTYSGKLHFVMNFSHSLSNKTYHEFRISHLRDYYESYMPKYGKSQIPNPNLPAVVASIGYLPTGGQATSGPGYTITTDHIFNVAFNNFLNTQFPVRTDLSWAITSQVNANHQFKGGVGVGLYDFLESGRGPAQNIPAPLFNPEGFQTSNNLPLSGVEFHVYPTEYFLFLQDRVEYGGLIVNAGIRLDVFDPKANYYDFWRPRIGASSNLDDPQYTPLHPSIKTAVAPRLGISHPVTDRAALHYSYGVFNQRPTLSNLYEQLVTSGQTTISSGNPDLPFMTSTNYEMGVQTEIYPGYYLDVTGYFRDVNNLPLNWNAFPEAAFNAGSQGETNLLLPTFAQDSRGFELSFRRAMANRFSIRANYTVAFTQDLSVPVSGGQRLQIGSYAEWRTAIPTPANYKRTFPTTDRRHRIVTNLLFELPLGVSASFLTKAMSGNEYTTKSETSADPLGLLGKARRTPWTTTTDLYAQKQFNLGGATRIGVFTQVNNLFNRLNVYTISGELAADRYIRLGDPVGFNGGPVPGIGTQGNTPRDIWLGVNMAW